MSAECNVCGQDLPYEGECEYCALRAENERLRAALERMIGTWPADKAAEWARAALTKRGPQGGDAF